MIEQLYDFDTAVRIVGEDGATLIHRGEETIRVRIVAAQEWPPTHPYGSDDWWRLQELAHPVETRTRAEWIGQVRQSIAFRDVEALESGWSIEGQYSG